MIISRTPFRVSFFGGGTDYPVWFRQHGGAILATTINKYCYLSCRYLPPFFEHISRIVWSQIERVKHVDEIQHPAVRETLKFLNITEGVELHHDGDLPARSGLGSSSAFTVGLLNALNGLKGIRLSKRQLSQDAIRIEQVLLQEHVGCQDQLMAAYGGLNRIDFSGDGQFQVSPVTLPRERREVLQQHLMLFYTGVSRTASDVAKTQIAVTPHRERELAAMQQMVTTAMDLLQSDGSIDAFGRLLHESWLLKRSLTDKISSPQLDRLYERARNAGAIGGKLLGAGGGGFLLLFVRPEDHARVIATLDLLLYVPFKFEPLGSQIIFYEPDDSLPARAATADERSVAHVV